MKPEEFLKVGDMDAALAGVYEQIRGNPSDSGLRRFLFQLLCVAGKWDKALLQLEALGELDAGSMLLAQLFKPLIACEILRGEVFKGRRTALIFGEPKEWVGSLVQANALLAEGKFKPARELRERALESASAIAGTIDGHAFEWIADADSRLGPIVEAMVDGKYFWIPFECISQISMEAPTDLRDLVWMPAKFQWTNGGEGAGFIPVRYPGSENAADGGIRLARKTEWLEREEATFLGIGQRIFSTNDGDFPILEVRSVVLRSSGG